MSDETDKPVTVLSRRVALSNRVWDVRLDHIRDAGGVEVDNYISLAARTARADKISGVVVLPLVEGSIALLRSWRHPLERYVWETPRGFVDPGEEPAVAAARELEEETGFTCAPRDLVSLGFVLQEPSTLACVTALYLARNCQPGAMRKHDEPGLGGVHILPVPDVFAMLDQGEIQEAATIAVLCRYGRTVPRL